MAKNAPSTSNSMDETIAPLAPAAHWVRVSQLTHDAKPIVLKSPLDRRLCEKAPYSVCALPLLLNLARILPPPPSRSPPPSVRIDEYRR